MSESQSAVGIARFDMVVIDCPVPKTLAEFYARILGWEIVNESDDWVSVRDTSAGAERTAGIAFQEAKDFVAPTWPRNDVPQQIHLDLDVADIDVAEKAVLALGATATGMPEGPGHNFRVYLDPVGHPFCLCLE